MTEASKKPAPKTKATATKAKPAKTADAKIKASANGAAEPEVETAAAPGTAETIKETASKLGKQAAEKARDYANQGKARAGGALEEVARMMGDAANSVDGKLGAEYGKYARNAADTISGWSDQLKTKELDDFIEDARDLVRKSPAVAIGVAAALGFVLARVIRAGVDSDRDA